MTDLQLLFVILALLYVWECACWVRRGSVAFRSWFGKRWRIRHPGSLLGNQQGGFVFAPPLPPLGTVLSARQMPVSISPEGALAFIASSVNPGWRPAQSGALASTAELQQVAAKGKTVSLKGQRFLNTGSASLSHFLAEQLRTLAKMSASQRQASLSQLLKTTLDETQLRKRLLEFQEQTRVLRILTNMLFLFLFGAAPSVIWITGLGRSWPYLLAGVVACTASIALLFRRAHLQLYPQAEDERFSNSLIVLLSPATAMRAHDLLSRPLLELFHPLAVAQVLCPAAEFRRYALTILRELKYPARPVCPRLEPLAERIERDWRTALTGEVERFLRRNQVNPEVLLEQPARSDAACERYCPRCEAQYTAGVQVCDDCGGLALKVFEDQPAGKR